MSKAKIIPSKFQRQLVVSQYNRLKVRSKPVRQTDTVITTVDKNEPVGYIVGITNKVVNGYYWYALIPAFPTDKKVVFVAAKYVKAKPTKEPTEQEAKAMLDELVENDKIIYKRLIVLGVMIKRLEQRGKNITALRKQYNRLALNLQRRQAKLKSSKWLKTKNWIDQQWENLKSSFGLGIAPLVAGVIGAVVAAVSVVSLYFIFKPDYDESKKDLKISAALKKALDTLPENERKAVEQNLEKQIDDAYNAGKVDGAFSSLWSVGKYVAIGIAGFYLIPRILPNPNAK